MSLYWKVIDLVGHYMLFLALAVINGGFIVVSLYKKQYALTVFLSLHILWCLRCFWKFMPRKDRRDGKTS